MKRLIFFRQKITSIYSHNRNKCFLINTIIPYYIINYIIFSKISIFFITWHDFCFYNSEGKNKTKKADFVQRKETRYDGCKNQEKE